jgi:hypothetical protein
MARPIARRTAASRGAAGRKRAGEPSAGEPSAGDDGFRRGGGLLRLRPRLTRLLDPVARQRGLVDGALLTDWAGIVGSDLASRCRPIRLRRERGGGVLSIRAPGAVALELQHTAPQIVERINGYFGFAAVRRLKLVQAPVTIPRAPAGAPEPCLTEDQRAAIDARVAAIPPGPLRLALVRLGACLVSQAGGEDPDGRH